MVAMYFEAIAFLIYPNTSKTTFQASKQLPSKFHDTILQTWKDHRAKARLVSVKFRSQL